MHVYYLHNNLYTYMQMIFRVPKSTAWRRMKVTLHVPRTPDNVPNSYPVLLM